MTTWLIPRPNSFLEQADLFFRDLFDSKSFFSDVFDKPSINYPVDIKETKKGLEFDIAAVGLDKKDIKIEVKDGNILTISHGKQEEKEGLDSSYICKGITRKAFSFAYKIGSKYELDKLEASLDKGLLKITIPTIPEKEPKVIEVK